MASRDDRLIAVLKKISPGTGLREGVDRIMKAGKGALVVLGLSPEVRAVQSGGFKMATAFTAQRLGEVAKMDGAIILDDDVERIVWANVHLVPDPDIRTSETGTRHRTAERVARQTGKPVIAVSQSMRVVTLYVDGSKHVLEPISSILFRANQALATLERYRTRLDEVSTSLSYLEVENVVTLRDALNVLQRAEMVRRIADEIDMYVAELGNDGRLLQLQLDELMRGVDSERALVVRDYRSEQLPVHDVVAEIDAVDAEDLLSLSTLAKVLGQEPNEEGIDRHVMPRGYRMLSRIPRLPDSVMERLVQRFSSLEALMAADVESLDEVEGVGAARARSIKEGLSRLAESSILERYA
ncbi:MAG: DNA integrity scanning diadenylate cyclase DisA [Actinobacteria bacterium]|nr:DNA integrity scanning diadenylate cyclase DisA [Actinomycetota bacterium]